MKIASDSPQFAAPELNLFNVFMKRSYPVQGGDSVHTEIINAVPLTYSTATRRVQGLLKPMGEGVPGFQSVIDCWLEPIDLSFTGFTGFASEAERDEWLAQVVAGMKQRREARDMAADSVNAPLRERVAGLGI